MKDERTLPARRAAPLALLATCAGALPAGCADAPEPARRAPQAIVATQTITIPLFVHFFYDGARADGERFTLGADGRQRTMADVDAEVATFNREVDLAAPGGARRLHVALVGVRYYPTAALASDAGAVDAALAPHRLPRGLNVAIIRPALHHGSYDFTTVTVYVDAGASFSHELGHAFDLLHTFDAQTRSSDPTYGDLREPLVRIRDPADTRSCYWTGDAVCDTPPDYGYYEYCDGGQQYRNACGTPGFLDCVQTAAVPCDTADPAMDGVIRPNGQFICRQEYGTFVRTYDALALGLVSYRTTAALSPTACPLPEPGEAFNPVRPDPSTHPIRSNMMAYVTYDAFTPGQVVRMVNGVRWRLRQDHAVPFDERRTVLRGYSTSARSHYDPYGVGHFAQANLPMGAFERSRPEPRFMLQEMVTVPQSYWGPWAPEQQATFHPLVWPDYAKGRAVLGVRVVATVDMPAGSPPGGRYATVSAPAARSPVVLSAAAAEAWLRPRWTATGGAPAGYQRYLGVFDESAPGSDSLAPIRGTRAAGEWTVGVHGLGAAGSVMRSVTVELQLGDRTWSPSDRLGQGVGDLAMLRRIGGYVVVSAAHNRLVTHNQFYAFNEIIDEAPTPFRVISSDQTLGGDLDGDGKLDLAFLSSSGTLWTSYSSEAVSFATAPNAPGVSGFLPFWGQCSRCPTTVEEAEHLVGDLNGDGFGDLVERARDDGGDRGVWRYFRGLGDGGFAEAADLYMGDATNRAYVADVRWSLGDVNADGLADIVVREQATGRYWVSINMTPRNADYAPTFYGGIPFQVGGGWSAYLPTDRMAMTDVNADGFDDLIEFRPSTGEVWCSLRLAQPTLAFGYGFLLSVGSRYAGALPSDAQLVGSSRD